MKKNYLLLLLLVFFSANIIHAQFVCPELLGNQTTTTSIHFKITAGSCANYAPIILVSHNGVNINFTKSSCNGTNLKYVTTGAALSDPDDFAVFFGTGVCNYQNGVLVTLSDNEVSLSEKVFIYPNPVLNGDHLNINFKSNISAKLEVYNVTGKLVLTDNVSNQDNKQINTSSMSNGIYLLKISTENATTTRKVVIMK